ncbi:glyoxalase superfamily protein [Prauserella cavernicola]|uniref:Bleomycin resistance protein n=1 Tax=Prauserella cavernicola TaxID=2800127 RepID=A0A934QNR7_9PSEU|nr:glyoxalase superfamily protein [Prauserella cavernicola]MBK1783347.1 bleomycin resistance family protein [Prauserella cavernicola]
MNVTITDAKLAARVLRSDLARDGVAISHSAALELVAHQLGHRDWNTASAALADSRGLRGAVPVLRVQDERLAREFYVDHLGFRVEWEHRFEPGLPLYTRVSRDETVLDLSEHHGDGTPGSVVWVPVGDVRALHRELTARRHPRLRPGVDHDAPGGPTLEVIDPFGNVLRFCETSD